MFECTSFQVQQAKLCTTQLFNVHEDKNEQDFAKQNHVPQNLGGVDILFNSIQNQLVRSKANKKRKQRQKSGKGQREIRMTPFPRNKMAMCLISQIFPYFVHMRQAWIRTALSKTRSCTISLLKLFLKLGKVW